MTPHTPTHRRPGAWATPPPRRKVAHAGACTRAWRWRRRVAARPRGLLAGHRRPLAAPGAAGPAWGGALTPAVLPARPYPADKPKSSSGSWLTVSPSQTGPAQGRLPLLQVMEAPKADRQALDPREPPLWGLRSGSGFLGAGSPTAFCSRQQQRSRARRLCPERLTHCWPYSRDLTGHLTQAHSLAACRPAGGPSQAPPLAGPRGLRCKTCSFLRSSPDRCCPEGPRLSRSHTGGSLAVLAIPGRVPTSLPEPKLTLRDGIWAPAGAS